jgi:hypothetical protein
MYVVAIATDVTRWFKYDQDDLCVNKSQFVPVIFEPPCTCKHCDIAGGCDADSHSKLLFLNFMSKF